MIEVFQYLLIILLITVFWAVIIASSYQKRIHDKESNR